MNTYPRRFYKRNKNGNKVLKYEESLIQDCQMCGVYFLVKDSPRFESKYCEKMYEFWFGGQEARVSTRKFKTIRRKKFERAS